MMQIDLPQNMGGADQAATKFLNGGQVQVNANTIGGKNLRVRYKKTKKQFKTTSNKKSKKKKTHKARKTKRHINTKKTKKKIINLKRLFKLLK